MAATAALLLCCCLAKVTPAMRQHMKKGATTYKNNDLYLEGASGVSFKESEHAIGNDNHWDGVSSGGNWICVSADRKGERSVANDFGSGVGTGNVVGLRVDRDNMPGKLNFYVRGDLTLTVGGQKVTCPDIRIAQGHAEHPARNNWWFGGKNCQKTNRNGGTEDPIRCTCGHPFYLEVQGRTGKSDKFIVKKWNSWQ